MSSAPPRGHEPDCSVRHGAVQCGACGAVLGGFSRERTILFVDHEVLVFVRLGEGQQDRVVLTCPGCRHTRSVQGVHLRGVQTRRVA